MPARRHLRLRATRRLGTTRNTRGFIFAIASTARFRGSCGRKKTVENTSRVRPGMPAICPSWNEVTGQPEEFDFLRRQAPDGTQF
jgi:hypothetical protein